MCRLRLPSEPLLAMLEGFSRRMAAYAIRRRPVGDLPDYRPVALARLIEGAEAANEQDHAGKRRRARKHHPQQAGEQDHGKTTAASEPSSTKSPRTGRKITLKLVTAMPPRCGSGAAARPRLGQNSRTTGRCRALRRSRTCRTPTTSPRQQISACSPGLALTADEQQGP